jgi:uncharacterized membrane protein
MAMQQRLYFLDALRALALLMLLQGHWISGLLDLQLVNTDALLYQFWKYCRGITAPVFFTISGWVFSYLLFKTQRHGWQNPRVKKGLKRALELFFWGYLLRLNLWSLIGGTVNDSFLFPDVLQIIGLCLGILMSLYFICRFQPLFFGWLGLGLFLMIFISEPLYRDIQFTAAPSFIAAYLTQANGGVFYLFPWLGYVFFGASLGSLSLWIRWIPFRVRALAAILLGCGLIFFSSSFLIWIHSFTHWNLLKSVAYNNFLFIRLGDFLVLTGIFMLLNPWLKHGVWGRIGQKTLALYIVHYFILYGSLTGYGVYKYFSRSLSLELSLATAIGFILVCISLVFGYERLQKIDHKLAS